MSLVGNNAVLCPNLEFTVTHIDSSSPDATVFSESFDSSTNDFELIVFTD